MLASKQEKFPSSIIERRLENQHQNRKAMSGYGSCPMAGTVLFWGLRFAIECPEEKETTLDTIKETSLVKKVDKGSYPTTQGSLSGLVWARGEWRKNL